MLKTTDVALHYPINAGDDEDSILRDSQMLSEDTRLSSGYGKEANEHYTKSRSRSYHYCHEDI